MIEVIPGFKDGTESSFSNKLYWSKLFVIDGHDCKEIKRTNQRCPQGRG
jgi:hypothetical protein